MFSLRSVIVTTFVSLSIAALSLSVPAQAESSKVAVVVNGAAITTGDVQKRINFLRLQHAKGNLPKLAKEQLIDEALERGAILKTNTSVSTEEVDAAFARFANNNKLSTQQLTKILSQAGVGVDHFKSFIAVSMSWPRAVAARYGSTGINLTPGDIGARIVESGGAPKVNEYILKQIIFVVPEKRRAAILGKRRAEAEASRKKFPGCDQAKEFAATMHDVSVRDLGRYLEPELPDNWKPLITKAKGDTTSPLVTPRGVEFVAICSKRQVQDDAAAAVTYKQEEMKKLGPDTDPNAKKFLDELRSKAQIIMK